VHLKSANSMATSELVSRNDLVGTAWEGHFCPFWPKCSSHYKVYFTLKNSLTNEKGFRDGLSDSTPQKSKEMPIPSVSPILSLIPIYF